VAELADLMRSIADGGWQATDGVLTVVTPPDDRSAGVLAFAGHNVVSADVAGEWVRNWLPDDDLSAPLRPLFLTTLAAAAGRTPDSLDMVLVAPATGRSNGMELTELTEFLEPLHPRLARALTQRIGVRAWRCPGGLLTLGRGVAGRWEVSIEVEEALRGFGLGRGLFTAARGLLPVGEQVWAQVAPGNAASIRAALAAGYQPVGSEVLLRRGEATFGPFAWFVDQVDADDVADGVEGAEPGSVGPVGGVAQVGVLGEVSEIVPVRSDGVEGVGLGLVGPVGGVAQVGVPREASAAVVVESGAGVTPVASDAIGSSGVEPDAPVGGGESAGTVDTPMRAAEHDGGDRGTDLATQKSLSVPVEPTIEHESGD
jgi:hypothetical protein